MAAPVIVSRVRATLHRQGYQGITQEQILEAASTLNVDASNPTAEDTKAVANHLIELSSTKSDPALQPEQSSQMVSREMLDSLPKVNASTAITQTEKTDMIAAQASLMGVALSDSDIQSIAQQVDFQVTDSNELVDEIKGFLMAFINYRESQTQARVSQAFSEIIQHASASNQRVSDSLHTGFVTLAAQMEEQRNHFKSSVRSALRHLTIPQEQTKI